MQFKNEKEILPPQDIIFEITATGICSNSSANFASDTTFEEIIKDEIEAAGISETGTYINNVYLHYRLPVARPWNLGNNPNFLFINWMPQAHDLGLKPQSYLTRQDLFYCKETGTVIPAFGTDLHANLSSREDYQSITAKYGTPVSPFPMYNVIEYNDRYALFTQTESGQQKFSDAIAEIDRHLKAGDRQDETVRILQMPSFALCPNYNQIVDADDTRFFPADNEEVESPPAHLRSWEINVPLLQYEYHVPTSLNQQITLADIMATRPDITGPVYDKEITRLLHISEYGYDPTPSETCNIIFEPILSKFPNAGLTINQAQETGHNIFRLYFDTVRKEDYLKEQHTQEEEPLQNNGPRMGKR